MLEINEYDLSNPEEEKRCVDYMKERHNSIQEQVQHLSQTINDFRDFYKPNQHPVQESLDNSIHKAIRILEPIIRSHTINLQTTLDTKEIQNIFVSRIVQTLVNIIKNAVDAFDEIHQEQPYIHISSYQTSTDNIITIRDNAGGISPENLEHIFDPYFSTKDDKNGTGLGLYMSKIIIEKHHQGSIIASSKNSETTFTITIPRNINL
ncbi:MAG TPA: HAMP domain-containing histidine kinase [Helicobacteraceae bacterium]|nr:HAMP domain-containing histidine kinase [Helicobacteraceae bacterium]